MAVTAMKGKKRHRTSAHDRKGPALKPKAYAAERRKKPKRGYWSPSNLKQIEGVFGYPDFPPAARQRLARRLAGSGMSPEAHRVYEALRRHVLKKSAK